MVLAESGAQRGMLSPRSLPSRLFSVSQVAGSSQACGFFPACDFALAVPFARDGVPSLLYLAAQTAPAHCSELSMRAASCRKPSLPYSVEPITPSQVWVHGVRGLGG